MGKPTDQEIQNFITSLEQQGKEREKQIVQYFLTTVVAQSETIHSLNKFARIMQGYNNLIDDTISGVGLTAIAGVLQNPRQTGFTYVEAVKEIQALREKLRNAQEAKDLFTSIAQFAIKFAPLILV
jgi:hypothetical protein